MPSRASNFLDVHDLDLELDVELDLELITQGSLQVSFRCVSIGTDRGMRE